jgi:predicted ATPase
MHRGWAATGNSSEAVSAISSGLHAWGATGATLWSPFFLSCLASAHSQLDQPSEARRYTGEAMATMRKTKETWLEAEINRVAGEIALQSPHRDPEKAEAYFERALAVAGMQQAKSLELRAAISMARLLRDRDRHHAARTLLMPVYKWFSEDSDTLDLKQAKALLDTLAE